MSQFLLHDVQATKQPTTLGIQDPEPTFPAQECEVGSSLHLGPNSLLKMMGLSEITNPYVDCLLMVGILEGGTMVGVVRAQTTEPRSLQGPVSYHLTIMEAQREQSIQHHLTSHLLLH